MRLRYMTDKSDVSIFPKEFDEVLDNVLPEMSLSICIMIFGLNGTYKKNNYIFPKFQLKYLMVRAIVVVIHLIFAQDDHILFYRHINTT